MTDSDKKLIAELEKRLCWYRDEAAEEEFDAEEVDAICVMLQKLSPIQEPHMSKAEAYENIMNRVREEEENGAVRTKEKTKKHRFLSGRRGYRAAILFIAAFGIALLSLNMATYARENKSLFTMILERAGLLEVVKEETPEISLLDGEITTDMFYESWSELDVGVKSRIAVPEYIPEEYFLYGIKYFDYNNRKKIVADYYDKGNGHLVISITSWEEDEEPYREMATDEDRCTLLSEYSDENALYYYAYGDEYICMVSMKDCFYRISGNVPLEEMIKIREGLDDIR